jgi:polyisoprenyl-phosphate glycosyltransferase
MSVEITSPAPTLSIVTPMLNEEATIDAFFARLCPILEATGLTWEVICVDDGSTDNTLEHLRAWHAREPRLKIPENTGDFRLMSRRVVDAVLCLPERNRFMKGLFAWVGFPTAMVPYRREERVKGTSTWTYWRLWNFALDGITAFSTVPLRVWSYFGLFASAAALLYALWIIAYTLVTGVDVPGYASLMVVVLFLGGVQLISLGVIGEYVGRIYQEVKGRPLYVVKEKVGFEDVGTTSSC